MNISKKIDSFFGYISSERIGFIKIDIIAHLALGSLIYFLMRKFFSIKRSLCILIILTLAKEVYDLNVMTNTYLENLKDIFFSVIIPLIWISTARYRSNRNEEHHQQ